MDSTTDINTWARAALRKMRRRLLRARRQSDRLIRKLRAQISRGEPIGPGPR